MSRSLLRPFSVLIAALFALTAFASAPASAETTAVTTPVTAKKASEAIAAALNRIATSSTTPSDFTAIATGTAANIPGVTITATPFYKNIVFFDVVTADGRRCVATRSTVVKPRFSSVNADCATYIAIAGPDLDRNLMLLAKSELRIRLNVFSRSASPFKAKKFTPALLQEFGTSLDARKYTVTNTSSGIRVTLADRTSVSFPITADTKGKYKI